MSMTDPDLTNQDDPTMVRFEWSEGDARWGGLTTEQIDTALAKLVELLGEPDTIT